MVPKEDKLWKELLRTSVMARRTRGPDGKITERARSQEIIVDDIPVEMQRQIVSAVIASGDSLGKV